MAVQHGLERSDNGRLQTLWLEFDQPCNLACSYCFANGGSKLGDEACLTRNDYVSILNQAQQLGVDSIGIPGCGEPLLPCNQEFTIWFLHECAARNIYVTLFSTGEFITLELAAKLYELPVELMIKGNSLDPEKQDRFVSDPSRSRNIRGYGKARNRAIEILMAVGFTDESRSIAEFGRKSRMALVTSVMTGKDGGPSNYDEVGDILRYCRNRNIIFDCDTVLERGRGATCGMSLQDELQKTKMVELQTIDREEYCNSWPITRSYAGTTCDRFKHHLYIQKFGSIHPCIGSINVVLGYVQTTMLQDAFDNPLMQIIRARCYGGVCGTTCANFSDGICNSCLGRSTVNLNNAFLEKEGYVDTAGCWNFRKNSK